MGDFVELIRQLLVDVVADFAGDVAAVAFIHQLLGESLVNTQFAFDSVRGDGPHFHVIALGLQVFDDIGPGCGGVEDEVFAFTDGRVSQLGRPCAGIAVGFTRPGIGALLFEVVGFGVVVTQVVGVNRDHIATQFGFGRINQVAFSRTRLAGHDDGSGAFLGGDVGVRQILKNLFRKNFLMLISWDLGVFVCHGLSRLQSKKALSSGTPLPSFCIRQLFISIFFSFALAISAASPVASAACTSLAAFDM